MSNNVYKIKVYASASQDQLAQLQRLGCAEKPFMALGNWVNYRAEVSPETAETMRTMDGVIEVVPMPTYSVC